MASICDQIVGRYPSGRLFVAGLASNGLGFSVLYLLQDIPPPLAAAITASWRKSSIMGTLFWHM